MANIELLGLPVLNAQGPFWSAYVLVSGGESEPTEVLVKLAHRPDETFARKMGHRYNAAVRGTIMRAFAEEKIKEALGAGRPPPQELTIRVTDADADLALRRWDLLK